MAAVTADTIRAERAVEDKVETILPIKTASTVYVGALANISTLNRLVNATAAASERPGGIVEEIINDSGSVISAGTGNTAGTVKARISWGHEVLMAVRTAAATYANHGKNVFVSNNNEVTDTTAAGTAGVRVKIGSIAEFNGAKTEAWIALRRYGDTDAV